MMNLINTNFRFSKYENLYSVEKPQQILDINELYEIIRYGYLRNEIKSLRQLENKKEYSKFKSSRLPAVTLSGIFEHRSKDGFMEHSGLMQIDIDNVGDYYKERFNIICEDSYTYIAFKSPGGNGIKAIVKVNPSIDTHANQFLALERYYQVNLNIGIDPSCKDISRCMLLSYDPDIYCNPHSTVFTETIVIPEPQKCYHTEFGNHFNEDEEQISFITNKLLQSKIDITSPHENWIKIGFSIAQTLAEGGRSYFNQVSSVHKGYNKKECDKLYSDLLKRNTGKVNLGTFIYLAKEAGVDC